MSTVQHTALLLTQRAPAFAHVLRAKRGFALHRVATIAALPAALGRYAPDVVCVDLSGDADARMGMHIREHTAIPLIGIIDAVDTAPDLGSYNVDALLLRTAPADQWAIQIETAHRRARTHSEPVLCDDLTINLTNDTVSRGTTLVQLPANAWRLLQILARHAPHPVAPVHIAHHVWNNADETTLANIPVAIKRLRERLGGSQYIQRAGRGAYRLVVTAPLPPVPTTSAPPPETAHRPLALPAPTTTFIGRAAERAALRQILEQPARLITLLGSAGIGKTRLALHVARDVQDLFPTIFFLPLADLTTAEPVLLRLAQVLGIHATDSSQLLPSVLDRLRQHPTLLIVDNVEHLIDDVALLITQLLHDAAPLSVLATSREPLDIYGEQRFPVAPLSLPHVHDATLPPTPDRMRQSEAVQLFVARAQLLHPQLTPNAETSQTIARICQHLNGVPLDIELAAAQSDEIALADMAEEFAQQHHLAILTTTTRDRAPRQRTVRDSIAWSYTKLTAVEQSVFRHLGSFATDFTTEAAHAVWNGAATVAQTHRHLQVLARKSLLIQQETNGVRWWRMLESIRAYTNEQLLEQGEQRVAHQRRLTYYQTLVEAADEGLIQTDRAVWMERLEREYPTIDAVLRDAHQQQNTHALQQITGAIWRFWMARGTIREGRQWCERALHADILSPLTLDSYCDSEMLRVMARAWNGAGALAMLDEDSDAARQLLTQALHLYQRANNLLGMARTTMNLGLAAYTNGDLHQASTLLQESFKLYQKLNERSRMIGILFNLSEVDIALKRYLTAESRLHQVLTFCQEFGDIRFEAAAYETLGDLAILRDDCATALALYHQSCALYHTMSSAMDIARLRIHMVTSDPQSDHAFDLLRQVFLYMGQTNDRGITFYALAALCRVLLTNNDAYTAAQIWGGASTLRTALSIAYTPFEQHMYGELDAMLVNALGTTTTPRALGEGAAMSYQDILVFAQHYIENHAHLAEQEIKMS